MELVAPPIRPVCYEDEMPYGYLKRLCELNQYKSTSWLLGKSHRTEFLVRSPELTEWLIKASWTKASNKLRKYSELSSINYKLISCNNLKVCPLCIAESGYWRIQWRMLVSASCSKHGVWLQDHCPKCHQNLTYRDTKVSECVCGERLSNFRIEASPEYVDYMQDFLELGKMNTASETFPENHQLSYDKKVGILRLFSRWLDYPEITKFYGINRELERTGSARIHLLNVAQALFTEGGLEWFLDRLIEEVEIHNELGHPINQLYGIFRSHFSEEYFRSIESHLENRWKILRYQIHRRGITDENRAQTSTYSTAVYS